MKAKSVQMGARYWHRNCNINVWIEYVVPYCISYDCNGKANLHCWKLSIGSKTSITADTVIDVYTIKHDYMLRDDDCTMLALAGILCERVSL